MYDLVLRGGTIIDPSRESTPRIGSLRLRTERSRPSRMI